MMIPKLLSSHGGLLRSCCRHRFLPQQRWSRTLLPGYTLARPSRGSVPFSSASETEKSSSTRADRLVGFLNGAITNYPRETLVCLISTEVFSVFACHQALILAGVTVPAEFALAFALSRPFRRLRLPLEIGTAAVLSFYFPALTKIKVTELSAALPVGLRSEFTKKDGMLKAGAEKLGRAIDKFGLSYFLAARWVGVSVVLSLYGGICYGMDVTSFVQQTFGASGSDFGGVLGTWAAAVVLTSTIYPFSILMGAGLARGIGRIRHLR